MVRLEPFKAAHLSQLQEQKAMAYLNAFLQPDYAEQLEKHAAAAYTARSEISGDIVLCAGITKYSEGRGECWAIVDQNSKREFLSIHNKVRRFLREFPLRRIEATVDCDFPAGHRWVQLLGFTLEAERMRAYRPDGKDAAMYALVKEI